jgi:1,4-dihydroxy-2-naphthoyl-CoA hydrolase
VTVDQQAIVASAREGLMGALGIELREVTAERVVATMPVTPRHHQPFGYLHGGASLTLAETAASIGGYLSCPPSHAAFGLEINANHLRPKRTGTLTATAVPLHRGRTTQVWEVRIVDEEDRLVCVSRCTLAIVPVDQGVARQTGPTD